MTRAEKRAIKNQIRNAIKEFLKIQAHYFPDLIEDIKKIMDERSIGVQGVQTRLKRNVRFESK